MAPGLCQLGRETARLWLLRLGSWLPDREKSLQSALVMLIAEPLEGSPISHM